MSALTHIDPTGAARMVDVGDKDVTDRLAIAEGAVLMRSETVALIRAGEAKKGDVLGTARIAGIMAAKRTHELVPLCHPLALTAVKVDLALAEHPPRVTVKAAVRVLCEPDDALPGLRIAAEVWVQGPTGVEMEALTAVSVACLTVYDMVKAVDRDLRITDVRLVEKRGGASGDVLAGAS